MFEAYLTLALVFAVLVLLATTRLPADVILVAALGCLMITGILTPAEALNGFSNPGVMTIAVLYVIAAGLKDTGAIQYIAHGLLGQPRTTRQAQGRLLLPASLLSAFMNNTAVVAMLIPAVQDWSQRIRISSSKLLLPLSYAAIMGGTLTLIGTSTNLVVDGLLQQQKGVALGMFELAWLGVPIVLVGGSFLILFGNRLLPSRQGAVEQLSRAREYEVEVEIAQNSPLIGKTIAEAGLRSLTYTYLAEIERRGKRLPAVDPDTLLEAGDVLFFIGASEGANELRKIHGLQPASEAVQKLNMAHHQRHLVEAVVGPDFPALGKTIRESAFRTRYKAVILSVSRGGSRLQGKLGDIHFNVGDTLLMEAGENFVEQYRFRRDFLLVSLLNNSTPPDFRKAPIALGWLVFLIGVSTTGLLSILEAALIATGGMLLTRCVTASRGRGAIDLSVLLVIAASFALGMAMTKTGAAQILADLILGGAGTTMSPWEVLALVYLMTVIFTEMITNNAAAVLMFPVAMAVADQLGASFMPFAIAVMFAASASFITPLGYQTNLMVYGPGGYKMVDYLRIGLPLSLLTGATAIGLIPLIWSF
ncbi:SLC13 family permease [Marinobacterium sediminicola]|uniref:Di- and tricarboxylate transporter n=1 Tax=Marinobacterium sediminicola TaxID=518898 RepID=A0ABY1S0K3_9GAMM|nr:SLC13 family permease [Marinobacterium sediminicola]ULG68398.1 SLC13 family permease [Marinobacterium sediminicola]SMR74722.1 Di- and tricarboxylate transporter [Marinobacterium sediminicola]